MKSTLYGGEIFLHHHLCSKRLDEKRISSLTERVASRSERHAISPCDPRRGMGFSTMEETKSLDPILT